MPLISNITIRSLINLSNNWLPKQFKTRKGERDRHEWKVEDGESPASGDGKFGESVNQSKPRSQHGSVQAREGVPANANPMKLVNRVKKIQDDLTTLKEQCRELLAAKQDLIDKAQTTLVGNRNFLRRMQTSMGVPLARADEDTSFANFNQIVDEWTSQVRARTGDDSCDSGSNDINRLLFSAITE